MKGKSLEEVHSSIDTGIKKGYWRKLFAFIGPAYLISVGYMDPGNRATDIAGGSQFGYQLIWVLLMSNLMALLLQSLSARLGVVRNLDLAQASRETYPKYINWFLYILAEIAIVACDLAEVIGMALGLQLLFGIPLIVGVIITMLDTLLIIYAFYAFWAYSRFYLWHWYRRVFYRCPWSTPFYNAPFSWHRYSGSYYKYP